MDIARTRPLRASLRSNLRGFTLIELMVTLTVLAVLALVAAPSFNDAFLSNKLSSYSNNFVASAQLARGEAIKRNATVGLCRSADGASCAASGTWQQGWIVFHDANSDGVVSTGETVLHVQQALSSDYHFTGNAYALDFLPGGGAKITGGLATLVTLSLCRAAPSPGHQERTVKVSTTARTSVETTRTGTCS